MIRSDGISAGKLDGPGIATCAHKRSKSFSDKKGLGEENLDHSLEACHRSKSDMGHLNDSVGSKKKQSSSADVQNSLRQEIMLLEKGLKDQVAVRCVLEKALGYKSSFHDTPNDVPMPKSAAELIKEIAVLEVEVAKSGIWNSIFSRCTGKLLISRYLLYLHPQIMIEQNHLQLRQDKGD